MIVTTTPTVEGQRIAEYLGVVAAQTVLGVDVDIDDETVSTGQTLLVSATGTAVRLEPIG